jgi:two-component system, NarL family, sensor histidine kinase DesK
MAAVAGAPDGRLGAGDPMRSGRWFGVVLLCLLLIARLSDVGQARNYGQIPLTLALFVLPLLYAYGPTRPLLDRHRWLALAVQAMLTWVPFALFGGNWQLGIGALLGGLVLLLMPGRRAWLLTAGLLVTEVVLRTQLKGSPYPGVPSGLVLASAVFYYLDDLALFFGVVRLVQIVDDVRDARDRLADLAVAKERLRAAGLLQATVGERIAQVTAQAAGARRVVSHDPVRARAQVAAAGAAAREAATRARTVTAGSRDLGVPASAPVHAVIGERLAWVILGTLILGFSGEGIVTAATARYGPRLTSLAIADIVLFAALQLYLARSLRDGARPRAWPAVLGLQLVLAYAFLLPFVAGYVGLTGVLLAGSMLLLLPGRWRWAGYGAVVISYPVLMTFVPFMHVVMVGSGVTVSETFFLGADTAMIGLLMYALTWLVTLARRMEALQAELARMAVLRERLRVARDVHDLLGLGLATIALKADLAQALIGRDDARARAEIDAVCRICASTRADIRLVTGDGRRLSLAAELATDQDILTSAGVDVSVGTPAAVPAEADAVLAPVLREAVTNILRHSSATACSIDVELAGTDRLRLRVRNNGAPDGVPAADGRGLLNLTARVRAAGGTLTSTCTGGQFDLVAEIPLDHADMPQLVLPCGLAPCGGITPGGFR